MFDGVARRYDLTNTVLSLGQDRFWRRATREALRMTPSGQGARSGGGDCRVDGGAGQLGGVVCGRGLLCRHAGRGRRAERAEGGRDATRLPFADGVFDAVTISFGLRNVVDHAAGCARWRG